MRRNDICLYLSPADRAELQSLVADRNTPRKLVWRAQIVLATADGHGTGEIMRRADTSKPTVWRWQERYLDEGLDGLKRDKTRPSRVPPLPRETRLTVIAKTVRESPPNATHWTRSLMAEAVGISPSSVGRISSPANAALWTLSMKSVETGKKCQTQNTSITPIPPLTRPADGRSPNKRRLSPMAN